MFYSVCCTYVDYCIKVAADSCCTLEIVLMSALTDFEVFFSNIKIRKTSELPVQRCFGVVR